MNTENKLKDGDGSGASTFYAFNVRDKVWAMRHNEPQQGYVYGVLLMPEYGARGQVVARYLIWFSDSLCSVSEDRCERHKEDDLARTKEDLLDNLFGHGLSLP